MDIRCINEVDVGRALDGEIADLRKACFPELVERRSYFKQLPHFRYLAFSGDRLVGHLGVDFRVVSIGGLAAKILGGIDLCVAEKHRGGGIGSMLLEKLTSLGAEKGVDFILVFADDHRLYERNGFFLVQADVAWLRIDEHRNYGVASEKIEGELMVKQLGEREWPSGAPLDLLGYLF